MYLYTRKKQRGGAAFTAAQSGCSAAMFPELAYHAYADMIHDHGKEVYNIIRGLVNYGPNDYIPVSEEIVRNYFFNGALVAGNKIQTLIPDFKKRSESEIEFILNEDTVVFRSDQQKGIVRLFSTGDSDINNEDVGVVQDNGYTIYDKIGGKNLLTFGSILDQAKKPRDAYSDPVIMDVGAGVGLKINTCEYGIYDIDYVYITGFRESAVPNTGDLLVRCLFGKEIGNKTEWYDAISPGRIGVQSVVETGLPDDIRIFTEKHINQDAIHQAGYFTSIAKIADVEKTNLDYVNTLSKKQRFYFGKFFGDTSLVASVSPFVNLQGGSPQVNPFFKPELARWLYNNQGRAGPNIRHVILKTYDKLNYVRAVIKGVPVVYQEAAKGKESLYFKFTPGQLENGGVKPEDRVTLSIRLTPQIDIMISKVKDTYDQLIQNLGDLIKINAAGINYITREQIAVSNIHRDVLNTREKQIYAANLVINYIIPCITYLKDSVVDLLNYYREEIATPAAATTVDMIKNEYKFIENLIPRVIPFTTILKTGNGYPIFDVLLIKQTTYSTIDFRNGFVLQGKLVLRFKEAFEHDRPSRSPLFYHFFRAFPVELIPPGSAMFMNGGGVKKRFTRKEIKKERREIKEKQRKLKEALLTQKEIENSSKELVESFYKKGTLKNVSSSESATADKELVLEEKHTEEERANMIKNTFGNIINIFRDSINVMKEKQIFIPLYLNNLLESYPNFTRYHEFLEKLTDRYNLNQNMRLIYRILFTIENIILCSQLQDSIYDTVYFRLIEKEALLFFSEIVGRVEIPYTNYLELLPMNINELSVIEHNNNSKNWNKRVGAAAFLNINTNDNNNDEEVSYEKAADEEALNKNGPASSSESTLLETSALEYNNSRESQNRSSHIGGGTTRESRKKRGKNGGKKGGKKLGTVSMLSHWEKGRRGIVEDLIQSLGGIEILEELRIKHEIAQTLFCPELGFNLFTFKYYLEILQATLQYDNDSNIYIRPYDFFDESPISLSIQSTINELNYEIDRKFEEMKIRFIKTRTKVYIRKV